MPKRLTRSEVDRIAALAHLELTDEEAELFTRQLGDILDFANRLQNVDTTSVKSNWHWQASEPIKQLREDNLIPSLPTEKALANAPDASGSHAGSRFFRVPKVIG